MKNVPRDAVISITITKISGKRNDDLNNEAGKQGLQTLLKNSFDYHFNLNGNEVTEFNGHYVVRTFSLPSKVDPNHATAVWVDANNKFHFIPSIFSNSNSLMEVTIHSPHNSIYTVIQSNKSFTDMNNHWAKADVELLANKLIVYGVTDTRFAPDHFVTRAEFAALLVRSLGFIEVNSGQLFKDVKATDWYAGAVGAAYKAGLIAGNEDGTFLPNEKITREQMVVMIARALKVGGKEQKAEANVLDKFSDRAEIADWAADAAAQTVNAGIIQGVDSTFAAKKNATRAQSAAMLKRMLQYLQFIN
ncbi:S-layer homology domain-containing protein [Cohnella kolymensis]|uniref:S-layer homology domain-containing protein n=1 Tax=Cohnella kolymensis TaxID=1590652 RepID=UPI001269D96C|nr:S-layer homology domain-containing protein [Cohnella kolymensis]